MTKKESVEQFLNFKCIAIIGVSSDPKKYSRMVYSAFCEKGYNALAVNPKLTEIDGAKCYPTISSLPDTVDAVIIIIKGEKAKDILNETINKGVKNIWLHQGCDLKKPEVITMGKDINLISGECAFMWLQPVEGFHKFHRFVRSLFSVGH
jgi:predicted CoA-binding protein